MQQAPRITTDTQPFFQSRRLTHTNLYVGDLDRTMRFYSEVVGLEEVYRTPLAGGGFVSNGNTHHDVGFITADGPSGRPRHAKPGQLNHLGFELETEADLVASYERATAQGGTFLRTADHDIARSVYGSDPDNNTYELYADVVSDWRNRRSGTVTKAKPVWTPGSVPPIDQALHHESPAITRVDSAIFHPEKTASAAILTDQLAEMISYYERVLGLVVLSRGSDGKVAVLAGSTGAPCLTLVEATGSAAVGYHHVSLLIADWVDLDASASRAKREGVQIVADMTVQNRRAVTIADPDGFGVQLYCDQGGPIDLDSIDAGGAQQVL